MGGEIGRGEWEEGLLVDVLVFCNVRLIGLGLVNWEESFLIKVWLYRFLGGCFCLGVDFMFVEFVFCVGGEFMELGELDRLLFGKWFFVEVEFFEV